MSSARLLPSLPLDGGLARGTPRALREAGILLGAAALLSVAACEPDLPDFPRASPTPQVLPLSADTHSGWRVAHCDPCHDGVHQGAFATGDCATCHGGNGAPTLTQAHQGWALGSCAGCHPSVAGHAEGLTPAECAGCHGDNGAGLSPPAPAVPTLDATHFGWTRADCASCHDASAIHGPEVAPYTCGGCHGANGGAWRPADHWLTQCNDCHAQGPEGWNEATHADYAADAPTSCRFCHH